MFRLALVTVFSALAAFSQVADQSVSISELMKSNPGAALRQLASEEPQSFQGTIRSLVLDDAVTGQTTYRTTLQVGEASYELYSEAPPSADCIGQAVVRGYRIGNKILASAIDAATLNASPVCTSIGDQKTVVILIETPSYKLPGLITVPFVQGFMSAGPGATVDGYFREVSGGNASVTPTVVGPYTLASDFPCVTDNSMVLAAMAAADAAIDFTKFNRIIMIAPRPPAGGCSSRVSTVVCQLLGTPGDGPVQASWGYIASDIIISSGAGVNLASKALGYGLGLGASYTRDFGAVAMGPFGPGGTDKLEGDHSIMGNFASYGGVYPLGHITARQKVNMGWYSSADFLNVQANSSITILPASSLTAGVKALRIRRGTGYNEWLWVEHRQFTGLYDSTLQNYAPILNTGVLIHHERPADSANASYLLNFGPSAVPNDFRTAMLVPGAVWSDPSSNLSLQVTAVPSGMQVTTTFGPVGGCSYVPSTPVFNVAATAGTGSFTLTTGAFCEWATTPSPFITITSGVLGTGTTLIGFSYTANATGAPRSGTILVGGQTVTVNQAGGLQITGKVTLAGANLPGVTVTLSGSASGTTTTNATGDYAFPALTAGSFTVTPALTGYSFAPTSLSFPSVTSDQVGNFSATRLPVTLSLDRSRLNFAAASAALLTPSQKVLLSYAGTGTTSWTAASSQPWVTVAPASGTGPTRLTISLVPGALPASGVSTATVTVTAPNATVTSMKTDIFLTILAATTAPTGAFDTPGNNAVNIAGSIAVTGWAMDDIFVSKVQLYRDPIGAEPVQSNGFVYIADTVFVPNARPDVETANPTLPYQYRGGWGYLMLTTGIPNAGGPQGNGTIKLWAIATDIEGKTTNLGSKTITLNNANATKPFGALDTPGQGGTATGAAFVNFGWALTPLPNIISLVPTKIWISLDGVYINRVNYGQLRTDIAAGFPGLRNSGGAGGYSIIDTTQYANGIHNIGWFVVDDVNNQDGIGSRFFFIENGVSGGVATPPAMLPLEAQPATEVARMARPRPQRAAVPQVMTVQELERVVIALPDGHWTGAQVINGERQSLPVGSTLDNISGAFYWQIGPGFLGQHELLFTSYDGAVHGVTVNIEPKSYLEKQ